MPVHLEKLPHAERIPACGAPDSQVLVGDGRGQFVHEPVPFGDRELTADVSAHPPVQVDQVLVDDEIRA